MENVIESAPAIAGEEFSRVALGQEAADLLRKLWNRHGPLMFHQSGGCCDGSSPMCFPAGEFKTGDSDILLGTFALPDGEDGALGSLDFWMSREQFEYWKHTKLTIDVVPGRGSGFSVEAPEGKRFLIRSEIIEFPER
ncbi:DUF779 domain-containing protein [Paeniglutamicibacter sp. ABSL32-1]|uniref:Uncharacterized protein (DUF779 family) n=1 Tax=Paeniglutamicibacter sulfureus TaxID=43666 RepID=A0ABU2BK89_9MICC|nr:MULTISPECIES: DUF779 domain-containing protein [Paeniglutamicibacter]MBV1777513.1 DUF779 domain-containing protein [Paeniglutamicibacter quisquiliarum]MDO2934475.1 DUF779 domain-containing protein [Paeniglutamicibacter sulfureus]MDR7358661.1 uncharacterized protein (DUF779 family) [Paeniglutamicibacter sulfureus]